MFENNQEPTYGCIIINETRKRSKEKHMRKYKSRHRKPILRQLWVKSEKIIIKNAVVMPQVYIKPTGVVIKQ